MGHLRISQADPDRICRKGVYICFTAIILRRELPVTSTKLRVSLAFSLADHLAIGAAFLNPTDQDLEACASEPIRIPAAIQPHGALFVLRPDDWTVLQASANLRQYLGEMVRLSAVPEGEIATHLEALSTWYRSDEAFFQTQLQNVQMTMIAHRSGGSVIVEVEPAGSRPLDEVFASLRGFAQRLASQPDIQSSLETSAQIVQRLTGFDRVLVYKFDTGWNGQVVAEAGNGNLPSYLDLRFPSGDIPAQARALYATNRLRIIPDADYMPVPIEPSDDPTTGAPLDLGFAQLRSVSPVHLEYMRNMGTGSSMSVSIMVDGKLWGLISCHSAKAHLVSHAIRESCDFLTQSLAMRISALEWTEDAASRVELAQVTSRLLARMSAADDWIEGLVGEDELLLTQVNATGAALVSDTAYRILGKVPDEAAVRAIIAWLMEREDRDFYATDALALEFPAAEASSALASGVIAIRISELHPNWLIWFRPEVVRTVKWGGDPHKLVKESGRIHPRVSFDAWRELVRMRALPWRSAELAAARELRSTIVGVVLRKAEELAEISSELQRSNQELEAFSYSVSHDLRAPFRHIVGFAQLLRERETTLDEKSQHYLQTISDAAVSAGRLVDDLLHFSQLGRASITARPVDMDKLAAEVVRTVMLAHMERNIKWSVGKLPVAHGDSTLLRQVWFNLVDNAVKYTSPRERADISIGGEKVGDVMLYWVRDNGVGFDMTYVGKLFGVFQRLQRAEDFEGTGIGLALVRRIVDRHNGSIKAEGEIDRGACFTFALPSVERKGRAIA
jgi:light-regulated signal transduction histidine kinase (bacteriophytochrome)